LQGAPQQVGGDFYCNDNPKLKDFSGLANTKLKGKVHVNFNYYPLAELLADPKERLVRTCIKQWKEQSSAASGKCLADNQEAIAKLSPMPKLPKVLYRGMGHKKGAMAKPGTSFRYGGKYRKWTSWSELLAVSKNKFARGPTGVVVAFDPRPHVKSGAVEPVLWPMDKLGYYVKEREWVLQINRPVSVERVYTGWKR